jgi:sigma-B regulation protein RsbU (phosphoserine phosphatase)
MFAAILRSLVRALPQIAERPAELLGRLNRLLFGDLSEVEMFITAQLAFVDGARHRLVTASAGHCPLLYVPGRGHTARWVSPEGMPLGILEDARFEAVEHPLTARGTAVLLYTDGLTEARDERGGMFGQERLAQWLERRAGTAGGAEALRADLASMLAEYQAGRPLNDDQTFIILNC